MRRLLVFLSLSLLFGSLPGAQGQTARTLDIYVIDVEGGEATLFVAPSGESLLVDTGWPGFDGRDADRIQTVAKQAGVTRIDHLVVTHFHGDHAGGVSQLDARLPIGRSSTMARSSATTSECSSRAIWGCAAAVRGPKQNQVTSSRSQG